MIDMDKTDQIEYTFFQTKNLHTKRSKNRNGITIQDGMQEKKNCKY